MREERAYHARLCQEKPKMFSMRCLLTLAMLSVFCHLSCLATPGSSDSIAHRFRRQLEVFPQEKIYVHTDRSSYHAGDTIWLRAHLVDASTHQSTTQSRYVSTTLSIESIIVMSSLTVSVFNSAFLRRLIAFRNIVS